MRRSELYLLKEDYISRFVPYKFCHYSEFNFDVLDNIMYIRRSGRGNKKTYNDVFIMADTETSKKKLKDAKQVNKLDSGLSARENHVCAWTISIRAFNKNICTLWGHKPSTLVSTMHKIHDAMNGDITLFYFHNFSYDHWFIRRFLYKELGKPIKFLNLKAHYPLYMRFENGIEIRDSLILAQKSLEKWADDLEVEHKKATGKWNYDKIRNQDFVPTSEELEYIEHDTLAGVECLNKTMIALNKRIYSLPYTSTGIIRNDIQILGKENNAKNIFLSMFPSYEQYIKLTKCFHGGYVHANRFRIDDFISEAIEGLVQCYDFCSSYPFCMLAFKYPMEKFTNYHNCSIEEILRNKEQTAFMFKLIATNVELKHKDHIMPALQFSKCVQCINPVVDNGRILKADYIEIYLTEIDLEVIDEQYKFERAECFEVERAYKDYLPRWFTDYVFSLFVNKCKLSLLDDPVNYMISKTRINGCYGLCVQKSIKENIIEDFEGDEYKSDVPEDPKEADKYYRKEYEKYIKNKNSILLYQHGVWVTSYAFRNLHRLNKCVKNEKQDGLLLYNDTDSGYAVNWDLDKIAEYNAQCLRLLQANGYDSVKIDGNVFTLGIAEHKPLKDDYTQFKVQGSKRYAGRCKKDGLIHITVAGVPKKNGAKCLNDDLDNFTTGFIFDGKVTGKKQHVYFSSEIYIDKYGNETADSIDLLPCDYKLDPTEKFEMEIEQLFEEDTEIQGIYENIEE